MPRSADNAAFHWDLDLAGRGGRGQLDRDSRVEISLMKNIMLAFGLSAVLLWSGATPAAAPATAAKKVSRYLASMPAGARQYYATTWGVDRLSAKLVESGQLVRFDYRIIDAAKAAPFNDRASSPQLLDEHAHVVLQVPTMEKVGPLRQSMAPENAKTYWMVFSNKGHYVKQGHRVSVLIGSIRVDGLIVQ